MQSAFYISSSSSSSSHPLHLQHPWKSRFAHPKPKLTTQTTFCNFLPTSNCHDFQSIQTGDKHDNLRLPILIHNYGKTTRYIWDGTHFQLECFHGDSSSNNLKFEAGFRKFYQACYLAIRGFFIPHQVQPNYIQYVKWKLLHRVFSSALQVLATQAMFRAMGVGYSRSLTSAAALNWVLKDGLGRLSRCIYTASLASAFDTNLKSAVHRSFAIADNLGEISAKAQIQTVCFDNLGLMLAALLNILCKNDQRLQAGLPFVVYPIFSAIDLFGIYQGLKHVHLQTLTKVRLEIILDTWIRSGIVPSPAEVSKTEGIDFQWRKCSKQWSIKIGCADPKDLLPKFSVLTICSLRSDDFYFLQMETSFKGLQRNGQGRILLCLREGASTTDIIMGLLQACYIRKRLLDRRKWEHVLETNDTSEPFHREWFQVVEDSKKRSHENVNLLKEQIQESGWAVKNILLSAQEKVRYSLPAN